MAASILVPDAFFVRKLIQFMASIHRTAVVTFDMDKMTIRHSSKDTMYGMIINAAVDTQYNKPVKKVSVLVNMKLMEVVVSQSTSSVKFMLTDYVNNEGQLFIDGGVVSGSVDVMKFLDEEPLEPHVFGFTNIRADIPSSVLKDVLTEIVGAGFPDDDDQIHIVIGEDDISFACLSSANERTKIPPRSYILKGNTANSYEALFEVKTLLPFVNTESPIFSIVSCSTLDRWMRNLPAVILGYPKRYETGKSYLAGSPISRDLLNQYSTLMRN